MLSHVVEKIAVLENKIDTLSENMTTVMAALNPLARQDVEKAANSYVKQHWRDVIYFPKDSRAYTQGFLDSLDPVKRRLVPDASRFVGLPQDAVHFLNADALLY